MDELHEVTKQELPALKDWLEQYLPETFKLHSTVSETIRGRWQGTSFLTLGWPEILAVGEGLVTHHDSKTAPYHMEPRNTSVFSPSPAHLKRLLTWPAYLDWSKTILFHAVDPLASTVVCDRLAPTIQEISKARGGNTSRALRQGRRLVARPGDVPLLPVPGDFEARDLDPDLHTDLILSHWTHKRKHSDLYIRELLTRFPSVGLFDKSSRCIAYELGTYYGTIGFLYVEEDYRRQGLGKVVTSLLAHKYFSEDLPVSVVVFSHNEVSIGMHTRMGFKADGDLDFFTHYMGDPDTQEDVLNFG